MEKTEEKPEAPTKGEAKVSQKVYVAPNAGAVHKANKTGNTNAQKPVAVKAEEVEAPKPPKPPATPETSKKEEIVPEKPAPDVEEDQEWANRDQMDGEGATEVEDEIELEDEPRLQFYTPSSLLNWGQFEVKYFSQIYTQNRFFDANGETQDQGSRATYYSGIGNVTLGFNRRINFGFDFWLQSVLIGDMDSSPFRILSFPSEQNARTALTTIGPKIKFQPLPSVNGLTLQSSFLIPIASDPEGKANGRPFLATQNFLWWTQIFYTKNFSEQLQLFTELDVYWNMRRNTENPSNGFLALPMSAFFSYFPTRKITFYVMNQFWPTLGDNLFSAYWYQVGIGGKYQFTKSIDLELSAGKFLFGRNSAGPANTFNLGLRFVKW